MIKFLSILCAHIFLLFCQQPLAQTGNGGGLMDVGVARVDITPTEPIRLAGYGARDKTETTEVMHKLNAKALAFGKDSEGPSILITVDLLGISERITSEVAATLATKMNIRRENLVICASHTHGGPEIGNAINILQFRDNKFNDSMIAIEHLAHIARYTQWLARQLEQVAIAALNDRKPAQVSWGQGQASFAANRRTKDGPTDPSLPVLKISAPDGKLRAILVNYACHGTTLEGINVIHGDWIGEAQLKMEERHPGMIALVAIGCGADANPRPRGDIEHMKKHGLEIAYNVDKLLTAQLQPLTSPPAGKIKHVKLPLSKTPSVDELIALLPDKTLRGYYARIALERIQRGEKLPAEVDYDVQVWSFGDKLAMINLPGEVTVDYSIRLKNELGAEHLWVNAYSNDVPCYIASRRVIREGGYEADYSMLCYDKPVRFQENVEDIIVSAVHEIIPAPFAGQRDAVNRQELVVPADDGTLHLAAARAAAIGPNIRYMPEWKAFGWFNTDDRAEWKVNVDKPGKYDVYLKWSVSDSEAGKSFVFGNKSKQVKGVIGKTGSWFTYAKKKVGTITLNGGEQVLTFGSNEKQKTGAMLDLADITLVPVKK